VDEALQHLTEEPLLAGHRLDLEPVQVDHAEEMGPLLDDVRLHTFTGGRPATVPELRERYRRQAARRSPDGSQRWLNWVARRREDGQAVGTVQATVTQHEHGLTAEVAWVVASTHQGHGYAREAAGTMVAWLRAQGVSRIVAHVHPGHGASQGVARAIGLTATGTVVDGEVRWQG
jgi:RimJ/RimL family protein N-acetyltransferase